ncbi:DUF927 domain-containing protein [Candidatus Riflebacteria bacterium]
MDKKNRGAEAPPENKNSLYSKYSTNFVKNEAENLHDIKAAIETLCQSGDVYELRILKTADGTLSGYFDNFDELAKAALSFRGKGPGIYLTLNPVKREVVEVDNFVANKVSKATTDAMIDRRLWLLVDFDPVRETKTASTNEELQLALVKAEECKHFLTREGWPDPVVSMSGNGAHLLYKICLPNDRDSLFLIKSTLQALSDKFSDEKVQVDKTVHNAGQLSKLYGTKARKGENTGERPHRIATILEEPFYFSDECIVSLSKTHLQNFLQKYAPAQDCGKANTVITNNTSYEEIQECLEDVQRSKEIVDKLLEEKDIDLLSSTPWKGGGSGAWCYSLKVCPFDDDHTDKSACIAILPNGALSFKCHHHSCVDNNWHALRNLWDIPGILLRTKKEKAGDIINEILQPLNPDKKRVHKLVVVGEKMKELAEAANANPVAFEEAIGTLYDSQEISQSVLKTIKSEERKINKQKIKESLTTNHEEVFLNHTLTDLCFTDVPLQAPNGWSITDSGIFKILGQSHGENQLLQICFAPVVIFGRLVDIKSNDEYTTLFYKRDGVWKKETVNRATISSNRKIIDLADKGIPANTYNANDFVRYLLAFENINLPEIPKSLISSKMGWQGSDQKYGFLLGERFILNNDTAEVLTCSLDKEMNPEDWNRNKDIIVFKAADAGSQQLGKSYGCKGTFEKWQEGIEKVLVFPKVAICILASFAAPLLELIGAPNFCLDLAGPTSTGKTTAAKVAASPWSNPDERASDSAMSTWDNTRIYIERMSAATNNLPIILDDTKRSKYPADISKTIYDITSGHGRGRGCPSGMRETASWRTILISTGENRAVDFSGDGGSRARVISIWGVPFEKEGKNTDEKQVIQEIRLAIDNNYGHAGIKFIQFLILNLDRKNEWREKYQELEQKYQKKAQSSTILSRITAYFATLELAGILAHEAEVLPGEFENPIDKLWDGIASSAKEGDIAKKALQDIYDWAVMHDQEFHSQSPSQPLKGWTGKWKKDEYLAFNKSKLKKILSDLGYPEPKAILNTWRDRGFLELCGDKDRPEEKQKRIDQKQTWLVVLNWKKLKEALHLHEDAEEEEPPF